MRKFTPWLGLCHLRQAVDDNSDTCPTLGAVWTDCAEGFEREMHVHTNARGQQMIWSEDVMSAGEWLAKHPDRKDGQRLAAMVNEAHPVEIGALGVSATGTGADATPDDTEGYLHIEEIKDVEPLDSQFGVHPLKAVPDALYEPLFGQPEPTAAEVAQYGGADKVPPLNTYAILDAAKVVSFVEMLEASGLEHRCLFKGKAAEEMRDVAPYVVRLEEGNDFTRNLFSHDLEQEVPWFMWDKEPGIYVRSRGSLDDMWRHFRKFTKVQDEDGKWFYFRFCEGDFVYALKQLDTEEARHAAIIFAKPVVTINLYIHSAARWVQMQLSDPKFKIEHKLTISNVIKALFDNITVTRQRNSEISEARHKIERQKSGKPVCEKRLSAMRDWLASYGFRETEHLTEAMLVLETRYQNPERSWPQPLLRMLTDKRKGAAARFWLLQNKEYID